MRTFIAVAAGLSLLSLAGCVAVSAKGNRFGTGRAVVAVDGRVYVVDTSNGHVCEVDVERAARFRLDHRHEHDHHEKYEKYEKYEECDD